MLKRDSITTGDEVQSMKILEVHDIHKHFGKTRVLEGVGFSMEEGEVPSILVSSGNGKTTLLRCINFLEKADEGKILVDGNVVFDASDKAKMTTLQIRKAQLNFGMVFQSFNLFPQYNVLENVTLAPKLLAKERPDWKTNKKHITEQIIEDAKKILERVGLSDKLESYPCQLSGGQQQRVSIARALAGNPPVILADEPTGALDSKTGHDVLEFLKQLHADGTTIVLITHDNSIAEQIPRVIRIQDGEITSDLKKGVF